MITWDDSIAKAALDLRGLREDGGDAVDAGDVDLIPVERLPMLRALMSETDGPVQTYVRHQAAIRLASWGYEDGVEYIEQQVAKGLHEDVGVMAHRMYSYDITFELFLRSLNDYWAFRSDAGDGKAAFARITPVLKKIVHMACSESFEISEILSKELDHWYVGRRSINDPKLLHQYLIAMLDQKDTAKQHRKPDDAVSFFLKYDPDFLTEELARRNLSVADFNLDNADFRDRT